MKVYVSVLMCVYNGERFLRESISSVLNQTFKEFEFIIINDGSTDRSEEIIREFSILDNRIQFVNKKNSGLTKSLNLGINMAKGEWIARIDDDDICEPKRFETQYSYAKSNNSLVLIGSEFKKIDLNIIKSKIYKYPNQHIDLKKLLIKKKIIFPHSSFFINCKYIKKIDGYNDRLKRSQDYDLCLRLSEIGKIACINKPLVKIRKHKYQVSQEDNGMRQLIDSRLALISFFLRKKGFDDPLSKKNSDILFDEFYNFVSRDISIRNFFKYKIFIEQFKFYILNYNLIKALRLIIKTSQFLMSYFFFSYANRNIEMYILNKWIKRKS